jgi:hypothetical protein
MPQEIERLLPSSLEAERAVLGAILLDNATPPAALPAAAEKIKTSDFYQNHHQIIYGAMLLLHSQSRAIDLLTLSDALGNAGNLQAAGGMAYLAQLVDGVPRISNVGHYAGIVAEKALLRRLLSKCHAVEQDILAGGLVKASDVQDDLEIFLRGSHSTNGHGKHAIAIDINDLHSKELHPRSYVTEPIFPEQGLVMVYAWRGMGKTYFTLDWAYHVACGFPKFGEWGIPQPRRCVYVDGEMAENEFQEREQKLRRGHDGFAPPPGMFHVITPDEQIDNQVPNIGTAEGQRRVEEHMQEGDALYLDSLSTLLRTAKEDDEAWFCVQEWLLRLRQRRISVLMLHHSGKSGTQRGTSKREDFLNTVITLRKPADYDPKEGLRVELHFEKSRGAHGASVLPQEVKLEPYGDNGDGVVFTWRPLTNVLEKRAVEMLVLGMSCIDIGNELGKTRFWVHRIRDKWRKQGTGPEE